MIAKHANSNLFVTSSSNEIGLRQQAKQYSQLKE